MPHQTVNTADDKCVDKEWREAKIAAEGANETEETAAMAKAAPNLPKEAGVRLLAPHELALSLCRNDGEDKGVSDRSDLRVGEPRVR